MPLNELSLEELTELAGTLEQIRDAGSILAAYGLHPTFDLTPSQAASISLPFCMPAIGDPAYPYLPRPVALVGGTGDLIPANNIPSTEAGPIPGGVAATTPPEPVDPPPAAEGQAGGDPIPSASEQSSTGLPETTPPASAPQNDPQPVVQVAEESGGRAPNGSGSRPPAALAPTPGQASHQEKLLPASWTEEEENRLVALVVSGVVGLGLTKSAAINAAARELGRPEAGTAFRAHHKLKDRLASAIAKAAKAKVDAETHLIPSPSGAGPEAGEGAQNSVSLAEPSKGEAPASELDPGAGASAKASNSPEHLADPITAHIMTLPTKGGWTLGKDLELMELSIEGWQTNEIALQLQIQSSQIKPRFDLLTGLYEDADGKKLRRFKREDVLQALKSLTAGKAA